MPFEIKMDAPTLKGCVYGYVAVGFLILAIARIACGSARRPRCVREPRYPGDHDGTLPGQRPFVSDNSRPQGMSYARRGTFRSKEVFKERVKRTASIRHEREVIDG